MCGVEVSPNATVAEIVAEAQKMIEDEPLEDPSRYGLFHRNEETGGPWTRTNYELKPKIEVRDAVTVRARTIEMTVPVPIYQKNRWQQLISEALPDTPFTVTQTGPMEYKAVYADEVQTYKVRFTTDGEGEEHEMNLFPLWENQKLKIQEALGREMIPDDSRPSRDGVLYVKSAGGSPPDPLFERVLTYTLGDDPKEFKVRVPEPGIKEGCGSPKGASRSTKRSTGSKPTKGQQVPNKPMEGHHPMATRQGSRAGGFRPGVGGSGQTDTCVASSHPSQT
jgi:hypothetical protein